MNMIIDIAPYDDPMWRQLVVSRRSDIRANLLLNAQDVPVAGLAFARIDYGLGARIVSLPFRSCSSTS